MDLTGIGSAMDFAKGIMDRFWPAQASDAEKFAAAAELAPMLEQREAALVESQKSIIVAEMQQGDNFTKRARPMVVYAGIAFIFFVHVFLPCFAFFSGRAVPELSLPSEFWWAWTGVCGVWMLGRTAEKCGASGKLLDMIMGGKSK